MKRWESVQDIMAKTSSNLHYPPILEALSRNGIPTVLVSAKSDSPRRALEMNHDMVDEFGSTATGIESFPVSLFAPETHKRCISIILRNIMVKRRGELFLLTGLIYPHTSKLTYNWHEMILYGLTNQIQRIPLITASYPTSRSGHHA